MVDHRKDPDTGKIVVNGKIGTVVEWIRWAMPVLIIPIILWCVRVEVFMQRGPRWTEQDAQIAHQELRHEFHEQLGKLPPESFRQEFNRLVVKVETVSEKVEHNSSQLSRIDERTLAIQRILEDR